MPNSGNQRLFGFSDRSIELTLGLLSQYNIGPNCGSSLIEGGENAFKNPPKIDFKIIHKLVSPCLPDVYLNVLYDFRRWSREPTSGTKCSIDR